MYSRTIYRLHSHVGLWLDKGKHNCVSLFWQSLDIRQPGTDGLRLNTRESEIFEGFRREGLF